MNELYLLCFGLALIFFLYFLAFVFLGNHACNMVPGYNFKLPAERAHYNEKKLRRDSAGFCLVLALIILLGGLGCRFWSELCFWPAIVLAAAWILKYICYDRKKSRFDRRYRIDD